ncbi:MAG: transcription antitermination factor NusB [Candidatus Marinimicrobia bacterium]|nr:transcription antitermination factor NusB [Candidatus Neomarinimicrobiota bacterium]|tara:strand:- start:2750 stop:3184 length:435 start_codon:yes stop_codon:yes gene_type:complete
MLPKDRRKSRVLAVQLAYGCELSDNSPENLLKNCFSDNNLHIENIQKYSLNLVKIAQKNIKKIDRIIDDNSKNWELKRIALTDKIVLRLAITEMLHFEDIPYKVSISEAVEISKVFGTKDSGPFVNGILDAVFKKMNKGEYILN